MTMDRLVINLILKQPYYGYILSSLRLERSEGIGGMETVYHGPTIRLRYDPEWLEDLSENHAYGAVIHELLHIVLLHPQRRLNRNRHLWAVSCDLAVNEHIAGEMHQESWASVARFNSEPGIRLEANASAETYYQSLADMVDDGSFFFSSSREDVLIRLPGGTELTARIENEPESSEINRKTLQSSLETITREASEEGEIPGSLGASLNGVYRTLDVNWRSVLRKFLSGKGRMHHRKTVRKVSRRFDDLPGTRRSKGFRVLAALDESGSVDDDDLQAFRRELMKLKKVSGTRIYATSFDTDCTPPVSIDRYARSHTREKRGGTDFRPVFEAAGRIQADLVIIFTDGDGTFPESSARKTLWLLTEDPRKPPPFGDTLKFSSPA